MQLLSRYLVSNKTDVVLDGSGNLTEYRKVYQRKLKIAKGIDNIITFEVKNHDQKPVSILNVYTPYVEVFTEDNVLLKRYVGTIKETTTPSFKGQFTINITSVGTCWRFGMSCHQAWGCFCHWRPQFRFLWTVSSLDDFGQSLLLAMWPSWPQA